MQFIKTTQDMPLPTLINVPLNEGRTLYIKDILEDPCVPIGTCITIDPQGGTHVTIFKVKPPRLLFKSLGERVIVTCPSCGKTFQNIGLRSHQRSYRHKASLKA